MRLLFIPVSGGVGLGPLANLIAIAETAAARGHDTAFVVKHVWAPQVRRLGFPTYRTVTPARRKGASPPPFNLGAVGARLGWVEESFIRASIRAEREAIRSFGADVVVTTLQFTAPISAAVEHRPSVAIFSWADGPNFTSPLYSSAQHGIDGVNIYNQILAEHGQSSIKHVCDLAFSRSELKLAPTIPEFQPELLSFSDIHFIGSLLSARLEADQLPNRIKNRASASPLIYVYLGPGDIPAEKWIPVIIETFSRTAYSVIVTLAQTDVRPDVAPSMPNIAFYEWLPGMAAITAADLVISHGGLNTVNNALLAGKPHIVFPDRYAERDYNGRSLSRLGAGVNCSTGQLNPKDLRLIAEHLLSDSTYARSAAEIGHKIRKYGGTLRAVELIESRENCRF
jgi:MGT family glycosyltransferase